MSLRSFCILACAVAASGLHAQTVPFLSIGQNFTASTLGLDSFALPPDSNGAAGPLHFVEFINGRFAVYSKSDGSLIQTMTDEAFWNQAGFSLSSGWAISDPRIIYDPQTQRWFALQINLALSSDIFTNALLLGISESADPTGAWKMVSISSDVGSDYFLDFPTLGLDSEGVYLAGDEFYRGRTPSGSTLISVPKADLVQPIPTTARMTRFAHLTYSSRGHIFQPIIGRDTVGTGKVLAAAGLGFNLITGQTEVESRLVAFSIQNPGGPGNASLATSVSVSVPNYTVQPNPTQPDGSTSLDSGDSRMSSSVYQVNGIIYAVNCTDNGGHAAVVWYRIDAASSALLESGMIADSSLDLFYPSVAANTNGTMVICMNGADITTFVSCYAVVGQTLDNSTTFGDLLLLKSGEASYQEQGSTTSSRWGDYSATSIDPADPTRFWTIQAYPSGPDTWSTQITELLTAPPAPPTSPTLTISASPDGLLISWPATIGDFQLEYATGLAPSSGPVWLPVTDTPTRNGDLFSLLVPASGDQTFFRLEMVSALARTR